MATRKLYHEDTGLDRAEATILAIKEIGGRRAVVLDATVYYPEGGGQPGDRGTINGMAIASAEDRDGVILHFMEGEGAAALAVGPAEVRIDAARRRDFATQHTAQHLLSSTFLRLTGAPTLSMRLGDEYSTIDVDSAEIGAAQLDAVEEAVMDAIEADRRVIVHLCPPERIEDFPLRKKPPAGEEIIRVVEIEGLDYSPCCGTHLPSVGPIGLLKITGAEKYKGMTRISFLAGRRAFTDYRTVRRAAEAAAASLRVPVAGIGSAVAAAAERAASMDRILLGLRENLAARDAERLAAAAAGGAIIERFADRGIDECVRVGRAAQKLTQATIVVASAADRKAAALSGNSDADLRPRMKALLAAHGGKGGGGPSFFQAAFDSLSDLDAFLAAARAEFAE